MDIREQRRITKKPETIRSLQQQAEAETEREAKASAYLPTLDEIAAECAAIRAEWTSGTEASRRGMRKCVTVCPRIFAGLKCDRWLGNW